MTQFREKEIAKLKKFTRALHLWTLLISFSVISAYSIFYSRACFGSYTVGELEFEQDVNDPLSSVIVIVFVTLAAFFLAIGIWMLLNLRKHY